MNAKMRAVVVSLAVLILVAVAAVAFWPRNTRQPEVANGQQGVEQQNAPAADRSVDAGDVLVGKTPSKGDSTAQANRPATKRKGPLDYGKLPTIKGDANPQVKAAFEAIRQKNHPERLSTLIQPKPFDAKAYEANPEEYLSTVEPGRVFQPAQPGPGVSRIAAASPLYQEVSQGESVVLRVGAPAGAPVSFTSFDCGQFENLLGATTVKAGDDGVAEAKFTTTPGTLNDIRILAACPTASGQVRFIVNVQMPQASGVAVSK